MPGSNYNIATIKTFLKKTDWKLLLFLILFLNVKIIVKLIGLIFIYIARPGFNFLFLLKQSRLPLFYFVVPAIGVLNYFIYAGFNHTNYTPAFLTGLIFWVLSILAIHQVKLAIDNAPPSHIHRAILIFFVLNIIVSLLNLLLIDIEIGEWNPYRYQGMYQKYFIGTGDYIKGISFDTSTTNAVINAFGIFYFLFRKKMLLALCCMVTLLLTCSNFINITVLGIFLYCFLFQSNRDQKSIIIVSISLLVLFMAKISPQNNDYAIRTAQNIFHQPIPVVLNRIDTPVEQKPDSVLSIDQKKYKLAKLYLDSTKQVLLQQYAGNEKRIQPRPTIPIANIHTAPYQHKQDSSEARLQVIALSIKLGRDTAVATKQIAKQKVPGKILAMEESVQYFQRYPAKAITGTGMGTFSSKLAFRTTGLKVAGGYPKNYTYINQDFLINHLAIFLDYFGKDAGFHSITNSPNSVYVQLFTEYGMIGLFSLFVFYLWFFVKSVGQKTYAIPVLLILMAAFFVDYWFEQLSIVILFELLLFLDKKENSYKRAI